MPDSLASQHHERTLAVFIDESGNTSLSKGSLEASNTFCCAAVYLPLSTVDSARLIIREVAAQEFSGGTLKSKNVGNNHERRIRLLSALSKTNAGSYVTIVDKTAIWKQSGLNFKTSFFKFVNRKLFERMRRLECDMQVKADAHGGQDFQESFLSYFQRRIQPSLLGQVSIELVDDEDEPLVQLADIIAGSWYKAAELGRDDPSSKLIVSALRPLTTSVDIIPRLTLHREAQIDFDADSQEGLRIAVFRAADDFLEQNAESENIYVQMQVRVLETLLLREQTAPGSDAWIHAASLVEALALEFGTALRLQFLMTKIIAPLRDAGVVIAGSSRGYRLATDAESLSKYLAFTSSVVVPMVSRVRIARELIRTGFPNQDILSDDSFAQLRGLVQSLDLPR